ncbi:magnesium/cobalt transporter CorA [Viridibacillus sp. YIM B01967]|uniref:Magnesium transport protein CorA n=1 Tax=Viridibacillus soli TaxID=2798301 RepID=A0ABS1HB10_9BACL|nr:magnesium/cobalt transporter CorA [Viridibacillus soli]MBK3496628.1 magnesium/cobalt transporter CorA [Viridibacillus soli]
MIRTLGITNDQQLIMDFPLEELRNGTFEWYWVDFEEPTTHEELLLDTFFHFHPLAIEDCLMRLQRPKLDYYDDYNFLVAHKLNKETFEAEEINIFVSKNFVVTFHKSPVPELDIVRSRLQNQPQNWERGAIFVTYQAIDKIVDSYFPMVYDIEDHLNKIDDELNYQSSTRSMRYVFDLRSDLLHIRRTILPMRDLLYRILNSDRFTLIKSERAYFGDIHDHLIKLTEIVESNRELTADMRDSHMSMNASRMNGIMMILTIISSIFIPLTFIAGVYGMNFENMPELEWHYSYFIVLGIMLAIAVFMLTWFKYKGWFDLFKP